MAAARTAIVTGGTRGIGLGIARALAAEGWRLVVSGVRPASEVGGVLEDLAARGGDARYCASDIAVEGDRLIGRTWVGEAPKGARSTALSNSPDLTERPASVLGRAGRSSTALPVGRSACLRK